MTEPVSPPWAEGPLLGYDTESDGVDMEQSNIVSATIVLADQGRAPIIREWLIDTGHDIPESATAVHGITTEHMRAHGMDPALAIREIVDLLRQQWSLFRPLVGHNPTFDLTMTDRAAARHLGESLPILGPVIDTLTIDREQDKYVRGSGQRKLVPACARYGLPEFKAHDATADTLAAIRLAWAESKRFPRTVGHVQPVMLHAQQKIWYRSWALGYAGWLRRQVNVLDRGVKFDHPDVVRSVVKDVELTPENIAVAREEMLARIADVTASADDWPMRPRPAA